MHSSKKPQNLIMHLILIKTARFIAGSQYSNGWVSCQEIQGANIEHSHL